MNTKYDYFFVSIDQEANRALAGAITEQVVQAIRPHEALFTKDALDILLELSTEKEVLTTSTSTKLAFGGMDLIIVVVVPIVVTCLTNYFTNQSVAGVRGLTHVPSNTELVTRAHLQSYIRESKFTIKPEEVERLHTTINAVTHQLLRESESVTSGHPLCGAYDCRALREAIQTAFSLDDLKTLCLDLSIDFENVIVGTKQESIVFLLAYVGRTAKLPELMVRLADERPHIDWEALKIIQR